MRKKFKPDSWKSFFDAFGELTDVKTYKASTPIEKVAIDMAEFWDEITQPGHGMFLDLDQNPELKPHLIGYLTKGLGWKLEKPYFARKPKQQLAS